jgi:hypothetical protein
MVQGGVAPRADSAIAPLARTALLDDPRRKSAHGFPFISGRSPCCSALAGGRPGLQAWPRGAIAELRAKNRPPPKGFY